MPHIRCRSVFPLSLGMATGLAWFGTATLAQAPDRVIVTAESAVARSCAEGGCRVLIELPKGQALTVLKAEGAWYQVMLRLPGNAMTTGWVEAARVAPAAVPAAVAPGERSGTARTVAGGPAGEPHECLTCVATRQPTRAEWEAALAAAAAVKGDPATRERRDPAVLAGLVDDRTTSERMREQVEKTYGKELAHLAEIAKTLDGDLQGYLTTCYDRFLPLAVEGAAPRNPSGEGAARPASGRAARFALWSGNRSFAWTENGAAQEPAVGSLCPGLWNDVRTRADDLQAAVKNLELAARHADVYPGVTRDVLAAYGLVDQP